MYGTYTVLGNSFLGIEKNDFTMRILETDYPIIERFIYPWMMTCLDQNDYTGEELSGVTFSGRKNRPFQGRIT